MKKIYSSIFLFFFLLLMHSSTLGSHLAGGNITYTCTGSVYTVKITIYRDCSGIALSVPQLLVSGCGYNGFANYTGPTVTPVLITPTCTGGLTTCNGGSNPGIQRYDYLYTFTLPLALQLCNDVVFYYDINARNSAITTLTLPDFQNMYLEAHLNALQAPCNTSPNFNIDPILFMCLNQANCFNFGATEPNGDSLIYSFINPRQLGGAIVDYAPGFDSTHAITGTQTISPITGDICLTPTAAGQVAVMAMKVTEKRLIGGVWTVIGSVIRDIQMYMVTCTNQLPTLTGVDSTATFIATGCAGSQICFNVFSNDANVADSTKVSIVSGPGTFTVTPGKRSKGQYCINTTLADSTTTFSIILSVKDNACPRNGQQTYNYQIKPSAPQAIIKDTAFCALSVANINLGVTPSPPGTYTYQWTGPGGFTSTQQSPGTTLPTATTTYTVKVTNASGCSITKTTTVTIQPKPTPIANSPSACIGASAELSAAGGTSYSWSPSTGLSNSGISNPTANPTSTTTYTVTVTNANGCVNSTTSTVTVNPLPVVSAAPAAMCIGATAQLSATGGTTYTWSPSSGLSNAGISNPTANPTSTTTYTVTATNANGCSNKATATVTVNPLPVVTITPAAPICIGASAQLSATGGTTYSWTPSAGLSNPGISNPTANPTATTTYTVNVTNANGCANTAVATVTVNPIPVVSATSATICIGAAAQLSATGGTTYSWNPPTGLSNAGISNPTANPTSTTTYTITISNANGCVKTATSTVTVNQFATVNASSATICSGQNVQLSASGGVTYTWSPPNGLSSTNVSNPVANPSSTTTYSIQISDANGCTGTGTVNVTVNPLPVVSATPATICIGTTAQLSATGGTTYSWNPSTGLNNPGINNPSAAPTSTTTYTVTVTNANGCVNTTTATVTVNPLPVVNTTPAMICIGATAKLSATGGTTYTWSPSTGLSNPGINNPTANPTSTTTYTVTVTNSNGCSNKATSTVTVNPLPVVSAPPVTICTGAIAQLSATGGTSYSWNPSTGLSNPGISNPTSSVTSTTTYTVLITNANGCTNTTTTTVTINPFATVNINPATICIGQSIQLNASGGTTYTWSPPIGLNITNASNPIANPSSTTTYSIQVTDAQGCTGIGTVTLTVNPLPLVSATPATMCIGSTAQLSATGGTTYSWNPSIGLSNSGINNPIANPTTTTNYSVSVTNSNGCLNTTTALVTVNPLPVVSATPATICLGATAQLSATGGTTYSWNPPTDLSNPGINNPTANPTSTTTYTITVSNANGCVNFTTGTVTVNPLPVVNATSPTICIGATAKLSATGGTSYSWNPSTGLSNPGISNPTANPGLTTTYTVTVTDANSCINTTTATVTVNPFAVVNVSPATICIGQSIQLNASGGSTYTWSPSNGLSNTNTSNPVANPSSTTTYSIQISDANGCTGNGSVMVTVNPLPVVSATSATICIGATAQLSAAGGTTYSWNPSTGLSNSGINNPTANPASTTTYTVTIADANGCVNTTSSTVTVNPLPVVSATSATICIGATAQISATGGTSYTWNPPTDLSNPGISNPTSNPTSTTTYSVTIADANGCVNTTSATVTVNPLPVVSATPVTICIGATAQLSATGGTTYTWSPSSGLNDPAISNPTANPTSTTTYSVTVTDANGCVNNTAATVTVNPFAVVNVSPATICTGDSIQLNASGGTTYTWTPPTGLSSTNISNPVANPSSTTTYSIQISDANGCTGAGTTLVTVNPLPVVSAAPATICFGTAAQMSAIGGTTYSWTPSTDLSNSRINNPTANPTSTTTYTVTIADANGCVNTTTATVTVNPLPVVSAAPATICIGATAQLSATGGTIYSWNPSTGLSNPGINNPTADPTATTTYTVTISDINGCVNTTTATVTVNPLPVLSASPATICIGGTAQLSVTGGTIYSWTPSTDLSNTGISNPTANPTSTTTYSVTVTDANGCVNNTSATVTVNPFAVVNVSPATICTGDSVQLNASGGVTYIWSPPNGLSSTNISNPFADPSSTTTYSIQISDINGCTGTGTVDVTVNPLPVVSSTSATICFGETAQLTATGGINYSWNPSTGLNDPAISNPDASPTATTTYSVLVTDANGCANTATGTITVNPLPVVSAIPATICIGDIAQLSATGGTSYSWNPPSDLSNPGISNPTANPTTTTTYTITITNANGCVNTTTPTVTVNPLPVVSAPPATICIGGSGQLSATGGTSYSWSPSAGLDNPGISNPTANPTLTTSYTVTVTDANGCVNTATTSVTVNPFATVNVNPATICFGQGVQLSASGGATYTWSPAGGLSSTNISNPVANPSNTTTYSIEISDANGCKGKGTTLVTVNPLPSVSASSKTICIGSTAGLTATGGTIYTWSPSTGLNDPFSSTPNASPTVTTNYTITVTDVNGCVNTGTATVTVNPLPVVTAGPNTAICIGSSVQLTSSGTGAVSYSWSPSNGLNNAGIPNPVAKPSVTTTYTIDATNASGCHGNTTVTVTVDSIQVWVKPDYYVCEEGGGVILTASGGTTYLWSPPDYLDDPTAPNPFADPPFTTTYTVIVSNGICTDTAYVTLHRTPLPAPPKITQIGDTLYVPPVYLTYQWYFNGQAMTGATKSSLTLTQVGNYSVYLTDTSHCRYFSQSFLVIDVSVHPLTLMQGHEVNIFPNPSDGKFTLSFDGPMREVSINIYNDLGQIIFKDAYQGTIIQKDFGLSLAQGVYFVRITACPSSCQGEPEIYTQKLVIR